MKNDIGHIERLYRESFSDFSVQPSPGLWGKIVGKLFWNQFLSFDISSFNVYYLSAIAGVAITGAVLLTNKENTTISEIPKIIVEDEASSFAKATEDKKAKEVEIPETSSISDDSRTEIEETRQETQVTLEAKTETIERSDKDNLEPHETILEPSETILEQQESTPKLSLKPPIADYTTSAIQGCGSLTVQFTNNSKFAERYMWHFGDGRSSTEENPLHRYDEPGEYEVRLEVTGAGGEAEISGETIRVYELPEANFVISPEDVTIPEEPVLFQNHSKNASRYSWDFGDISSSTEMEPTHYYVTEGKFHVRLDVWNEAGCHDSLIVQDAFASSGCQIEFPTAFAPNPNGPSNGYYTDGPTGNEVFHPVCKGVVEYQLRIYNRNGALVFESNDINIGWDGYFKGALAKQDVYVWKVQGRFRNGKEFMENGNVTLIVKR